MKKRMLVGLIFIVLLFVILPAFAEQSTTFSEFYISPQEETKETNTSLFIFVALAIVVIILLILKLKKGKTKRK